jgi:hypothetical protein
MSVDSFSTNPRRATQAVAVGALSGALGVTTVILLLAALDGGITSASDLLFSVLIFVVALIGWTLGLFLLGLPLWWFLHRNGWRGRRSAALLGAGTTFVVVLLLQVSDGMFAPTAGGSGILMLFARAGFMALLGAIVALVIWRIAYRPADNRA